MKKFFVVAGTLLLVAIVIAIVVLSNPLRKSEEQIRESILAITPVGMNMDDVIKVLESNDDWEELTVYEEWGILYDKRLNRPTHYANYIDELSENFDIIGKKSISVDMGHYSVVFGEKYVRAWWAFDVNSKMIDVVIEKDVSSF